jgi:hypothetical protein
MGRLSLREGSGPDRHPPSPDVMAVGAVFIPRSSPQITPMILQPRCGFFATKLRPKLCVPRDSGNRARAWIAAASSAADDHTASSGDPHDGESQPYRLPTISSINAPTDRFTVSLLILFNAIRVR